ncbi:MAG: glycosyltransferase [Deferribacteres bacterium]|nr:glycosyltransferase [Deferribacteres bacterium]
MKNVKYSIIIPNLNSPRIDEVLHALRKQRGVEGEFEILVIGRDSHGMVPPHVAEDDRVHFHESERNLNPAEARNIGINSAAGDVLFFIDSDCVARPDWMANLLKTYREGHPVIGGSMEFDGRDGFWTLCDNIAHFNNHHYSTKRGVFDTVPLLTANLCVRKDIAVRSGKFNEQFARGQDFDFCMRIRELDFELFFEPDAVVRHRPTRNTFQTMIGHSAAWAPFSIRIREKYADILRTPWYLTRPWPLLLLSPLISAAVLFRVYVKHPPLLKYLYTAPFIFTDRMAWCYYVFKELRKGHLDDIFETDQSEKVRRHSEKLMM